MCVFFFRLLSLLGDQYACILRNDRHPNRVSNCESRNICVFLIIVITIEWFNAIGFDFRASILSWIFPNNILSSSGPGFADLKVKYNNSFEKIFRQKIVQWNFYFNQKISFLTCSQAFVWLRGFHRTKFDRFSFEETEIRKKFKSNKSCVSLKDTYTQIFFVQFLNWRIMQFCMIV